MREDGPWRPTVGVPPEARPFAARIVAGNGSGSTRGARPPGPRGRGTAASATGTSEQQPAGRAGAGAPHARPTSSRTYCGSANDALWISGL